MELLEATVFQTGNILQEKQFSATKDPDRGELFVVKLDVKGDFSSLLVLVSKLKNFPLLLAIDTMTITRLESQELTFEDRAFGLSEGAIRTEISWHMPTIQ